VKQVYGKKLVVPTLIVALLWTPLWAQSTPDQKHIDEVRQKVAGH